MILLFSTEEASVTIRFDLTSFADKIYKWCEGSELRNLHNGTTFTALWPTIFKDNFSLSR